MKMATVFGYKREAIRVKVMVSLILICFYNVILTKQKLWKSY